VFFEKGSAGAFSGLLFALFSAALANHYFGAFITSDAFERARAAQLIIDKGYPMESAAVGAGNSSYPPIFDFSLASFHVLAGVSYENSIFLLSLAYSALLFLLVFLICKDFSLEFRFTRSAGSGGAPLSAVFGALFFFLSPWIFFRAVNPIAETLGTAFYLLAFFAFWRRKPPWAVALVFLALSLSHFRSFAAATICTGMLAVLEGRKLEYFCEWFLGGILFVSMVPLSSLGYSNPFVVTPGIPDFFSLPLLLAAAGGIIIAVLNFKKIPDSMAALVAAPLVLSVFAPFSFRQVPYLVVVAAIFCSLFFAKAFFSRWFGLATLASVFAIAFSANAFVVSRTPPVSNELAAVETKLGSFPQKNIAAGFVESYAIPYYAGKKVLLGSFAEELANYRSRVSTTKELVDGNVTEATSFTLHLYGVDFLLLGYSNSTAPLDGLNVERLLASDTYSGYSFQA
jgi:hypothetical protein